MHKLLSIARGLALEPREKDGLVKFLNEIEQNHVLVSECEPLLDLEKYKADFKAQMSTETNSEVAYQLYDPEESEIQLTEDEFNELLCCSVCFNLLKGKNDDGVKSCLSCVTMICKDCFPRLTYRSCPTCRDKALVRLSFSQVRIMDKVKLRCEPCNKLLNLDEF